MRRLFTVLFILIASAAYAEDVLTLDKVFFIPPNLQEKDVKEFMSLQKAEYQKQLQENNIVEYGASMDFEESTAREKDQSVLYWFTGICYLNKIKYESLFLIFKNSVLSEIWFLPNSDVSYTKPGSSEEFFFDKQNTEFTNLIITQTNGIFSLSTFIEDDMPYVEIMCMKVGTLLGKRSYIIRQKTSTEYRYSFVRVIFYNKPSDLEW